MLSQLLRTKSPTRVNEEGSTIALNRTLGPWGLTALGIGAVIGGGIFVITGQAAAEHAGPAIVLSFIIAAVCCSFTALCYAEFATLIPMSGSSYSYAYATLGEFVAWFIGWNMVLEYGVSASAVAVSWTGYFTSLLGEFGIHLPEALTNAPLAFTDNHIVVTGALFNLPAVAIVLALTWLCYIGIRESSGMNTFMVALKVVLILIVVVVGSQYVNTALWHPFIPEAQGPEKYGWGGIMRGATLVFFSYIGFEATSTAAQEAKNPQRDLPIGTIASLAICTVLYIAHGSRPDRTAALRPARHRGAGRHRGARAPRTGRAALGRRGRRADRPVVGDSRHDHRAAAHLHDHGQRRPAAAGVREDPSEIPHAAHQHRDHGHRHRAARGDLPARHPRRPRLDGHPDRVRARSASA